MKIEKLKDLEPILSKILIVAREGRGITASEMIKELAIALDKEGYGVTIEELKK